MYKYFPCILLYGVMVCEVSADLVLARPGRAAGQQVSSNCTNSQHTNPFSHSRTMPSLSRHLSSVTAGWCWYHLLRVSINDAPYSVCGLVLPGAGLAGLQLRLLSGLRRAARPLHSAAALRVQGRSGKSQQVSVAAVMCSQPPL